MNIPLKVWGWALAIAVLAFIGWRIDAHARKDALAQVRDSTFAAKLDSTEKAGEMLKAKFKTDTLRLFKRISVTDTLLRTRIDSAIVHHTDTITFTIKEAAAIDTTIRSCKETVLSCAARADNAESQVSLWQGRYENLKGTQPGFLRRRVYAGVGYCAVVNNGTVLTGPCASVGLRIWP